MLVLKRLEPLLIERRRKRRACAMQAGLRHTLVRGLAYLVVCCNHLPDKIVGQILGDTAPEELAGSHQVRPQDCVVRADYFNGEKTSIYGLAIRCWCTRTGRNVALDPDLAAPFNNCIRPTRSCNDLELSALPKLFDQALLQLRRAISAAQGRDKYFLDLGQVLGGLCVEGDSRQDQHDPASSFRCETTGSVETILHDRQT